MDNGIRRRQAMVFQRPVLLRRTAAANITYALGLRGLARSERGSRALRALGLAGLAHHAIAPARVLFNQYGAILVSPVKHPNVKAKEGQAFIDWLTGSEGQAAIADYKIDGQQLFFPNARPQS
jgi:ABC-type ATPase involved in cell division